MENMESRMKDQKLRFTIACKNFPVRSQTFILNQILDLIDKGHDVNIVVYEANKELLGQVDPKYRLAERISTTDMPQSFVLRVFGLLIFTVTHPAFFIKILQTVNFFKFGKIALSLKLFYSAKVFLKQPKYDLYQAHFGEVGMILSILKSIGIVDGRIITTFHGYDAHFSDATFATTKAIYTQLFGAKDNRFTVNSDYTKNQIISLGARENTIYNLPVGLDTQKYQRKTKTTQREQLRLISVGRLVPFKGFEYSIRAVAKLVNDGFFQIHYSIIGEGTQYVFLDSLIKQLGMSQHVFLIGAKSQEEVIAKMSDSDLFVHPAIRENNGRQENQGLVIQEAQALELPVITTRTGGIPEGLIENKTGLLVEEKNIDHLANSILFFAQNKPEIERFGKAGRDFVVQNFDIKTINDRLVSVYEEVLK